MILIRVTAELRPDEQRTALLFVRSERSRNTDSLGFIPWNGVLRHHENRKLAVCYRNSDLVGFILWGGSNGVCRVFQLCVRTDARRVEHGRALARLVERWAEDRRWSIVRARVAADLPAVSFWEAIGFRINEIGPGGTRRGRIVLTFQKVVGITPASPSGAAAPPQDARAQPSPQPTSLVSVQGARAAR